MPLAVLLTTAFLEGLSVLLIEILGARALAPYFGGSLAVWTAQITATLLFLALGYRVGGALAARPQAWHLPALFGAAGTWLLLDQVSRKSLMGSLAANLGVAFGSFVSACLLFGLPLLCLGAVSPILIGAIDRSRPGAGSAAGTLFFVNTIGGLAGGWATAFLVIPFLSITAALAATGGLLLALAVFWAATGRGVRGALTSAAIAGVVTAGVLTLLIHLAPPPGGRVRVRYEAESSIGKIQVIDDVAGGRRSLLVDGATQNEIFIDTGRPVEFYTRFLDALSRHFAPGAKRALALGLGAGVLPRAFASRGIAVTAVEIEPRVEDVARRFFGVPEGVGVEIADARTFLRRRGEPYDLVILDVFAAESAPWHLLTVEAFREMKAVLAPGGRLLINTFAMGDSTHLGLARIEASLLAVFPEVLVYVGRQEELSGVKLANAALVAGDALAADAARPPAAGEVADALEFLLPRGRAARGDVAPATDDWSDLDYAEAEIRMRYRELLLQLVPPV